MTSKALFHHRFLPYHLQCQWRRCISNSATSTTSIRRFNDDSATSMSSDQGTTPVVIIGGGPTGLCLSILLSQYNIPTTLIEARTPDQIHQHPQAHYLNLRTMEILRHYMPNVYRRVLQEMPPVEHWERFTFSHSVLGRQIGRVVHPVRGIRVGQDGNGVLVPRGEPEIKAPKENEDMDLCDRISICNPGHLAQNKFASILLHEAMRASSKVPGAQIIHGEKVTSVCEEASSSCPLEIRTENGSVIQAEYIVAADGSASPTRNANDHGIGMSGNPSMQNLINVHFRTSPEISKQLKERTETIGMLHFVFNQNVVGAYVCHDLDKGDWVLQIPFFPPFQNPKTYTADLVRSIVMSGLGLSVKNGASHCGIDILSIKPWKMAATVAPSYFVGQSKRIILAGDAAHVFPPAGGFGMNTGIQDAHNLAWRLSCVLGKSDVNTNSSSTSKKDSEVIHPILKKYQSERRPIASQNAALSVRNYKRTLDIAKACYLNSDHPTLLIKMMESPPLNLTPMTARQNIFDASVKTAMMPLSNLGFDGNFFSRISKNIRSILGSGGGLPLLFPRYEVGFSYSESSLPLDELDDTTGFNPMLKVGFRLPHLPVKILNSNDDSDEIATGSLTDIESHISMRWKDPEAPSYSLIFFTKTYPSASELNHLKELEEDIQRQFRLSVSIIEIYLDEEMAKIRYSDCVQEADRHIVHQIVGETLSSTLFPVPCTILVRPDGHVEKIFQV